MAGALEFGQWFEFRPESEATTAGVPGGAGGGYEREESGCP